MWLQGPSHIQGTEQSYSSELFESNEEMKDLKNISCTVLSDENSISFERCSSYFKAQKLMGWILRFCNNCRKKVIDCLIKS